MSDQEKYLQKVDKLVNENSLTDIQMMAPLAAAHRQATALVAIREQLPQKVVETVIMPLAGSRLGYTTDGKNYTWKQHRDFAIEALLRGFRLVGNECTMIAGNFYGGRAGFERLVKGLGFHFLEWDPGIPEYPNKTTAIMRPIVRWAKREGDPLSTFERKFLLAVDTYTTPDNLAGKATRKILAAFWNQLTGIDAPDADEGQTTIDVTGAARLEVSTVRILANTEQKGDLLQRASEAGLDGQGFEQFLAAEYQADLSDIFADEVQSITDRLRSMGD